MPAGRTPPRQNPSALPRPSRSLTTPFWPGPGKAGAALRGHRQWQDPGVPAAHRPDPVRGAQGHRHGAGDQPDPPGHRTVPLPLWKPHGCIAQLAHHGAAHRRVAANPGRGSGYRHRYTQRRVCTGGESGPHRHRRGAGAHLSVRIRSAFPYCRGGTGALPLPRAPGCCSVQRRRRWKATTPPKPDGTPWHSSPSRYSGQLPDVTIVDTTCTERVGELFSEPLCAELLKNLEMGQQSILLLNRRGYHTRDEMLLLRRGGHLSQLLGGDDLSPCRTDG